MILEVESIGNLNSISAVVGVIFLLLLTSIKDWLIAKKVKSDQQKTMALLHTQVQNVKDELKPNGGSSSRDVIDRIESSLSICIKDIADMKFSYKKIESSQKVRLEMLMNSSPECVFICDESGSCVFANLAMKNLYGMDKLTGNERFRAITTQAERQAIVLAWNNAAKTKTSFRYEYEIMNQLDKQKHNISSSIEPVFDDDGNFIQFNGLIKVKE